MKSGIGTERIGSYQPFRPCSFLICFFSKGLGAKESHDNDWIAQQDDFNNLLSALQQHGGNAGELH